MPVKEVAFEVNGRKYRVMELPPTSAIPLLLRISKFCGPLVSALAAMAPAAGKEDEIQESAMGSAMGALSGIDPEQLTSLLFTLTSGVFAVDKNLKINDPDAYFNEFPADLFPVAVHNGKIQFSRFLAGGDLALFLKRAGSQFPQTSISTGDTGD
jgi:hypothetical protein